MARKRDAAARRPSRGNALVLSRDRSRDKRFRRFVYRHVYTFARPSTIRKRYSLRTSRIRNTSPVRGAKSRNEIRRSDIRRLRTILIGREVSITVPRRVTERQVYLSNVRNVSRVVRCSSLCRYASDHPAGADRGECAIALCHRESFLDDRDAEDAADDLSLPPSSFLLRRNAWRAVDTTANCTADGSLDTVFRMFSL